MSKKILVTRPEHDVTTKYLSSYAKLVIKYAQEKGIFVKDFEQGNIKKQEIEMFIQKQNPKLIFLNGHGDVNCIEGDKSEIIIRQDENDEILKGKITYARSCYVASSLGKKCGEMGLSTCFIGYKFPFQFWIDETRSGNPLKDKTAELYLLPSNKLVEYLIKGNKIGIAFEKSKKLMVENMRKIKNEEEPGALERFKALWINYEGQEIYGDEEAYF